MRQTATKASGLSFELWKRRVDQWLYSACDMHSDDLPDWSYRAAYDDNMRPSEAARRALTAARNF